MALYILLVLFCYDSVGATSTEFIVISQSDSGRSYLQRVPRETEDDVIATWRDVSYFMYLANTFVEAKLDHNLTLRVHP